MKEGILYITQGFFLSTVTVNKGAETGLIEEHHISL